MANPSETSTLPLTSSDALTRATDRTQLRATRAAPFVSKAMPEIHGSALPAAGSTWTSGPKEGMVRLVWPRPSGSNSIRSYPAPIQSLPVGAMARRSRVSS